MIASVSLPRSDKTNGIYRIIRSALKKKKIVYEGNKKAIREYIHVEDAADSSVKILNSKFKNKHLILTGQRPKKVYDVMKMIAEILGLDKKIFIGVWVCVVLLVLGVGGAWYYFLVIKKKTSLYLSSSW